MKIEGWPYYILKNKSMNWHKNIAEYFAEQPHFLDGEKQKKPNVRKCEELRWQETKGECWDEVTKTLCDLDFIQTKCAAKHTYDLINDYNVLLAVIPDNAENIRKEKERQARLDKYAKDLVLYSKGEIKKKPRSVRPSSSAKPATSNSPEKQMPKLHVSKPIQAELTG